MGYLNFLLAVLLVGCAAESARQSAPEPHDWILVYQDDYAACYQTYQGVECVFKNECKGVGK